MRPYALCSFALPSLPPHPTQTQPHRELQPSSTRHPVTPVLAPPPTLSLYAPPTPPTAVPQALPSIEVWTSGIKASCATPLVPPEAAGAPWQDATTTPAAARPCTYVYSAAMAASVTAASASLVHYGDALTVTGTGFVVRPFVQLVRVGSPGTTADCDVTAFTPTSFTCTVGAGASGAYTLQAIVGTCAVPPRGGAGLSALGKVPVRGGGHGIPGRGADL